MTDITQCPQCGTHFKITEAQRNAHQGMVRCGKCQTVFNAVENLYTPQPQQLDLPLVLDEIADATGMFEAYDPNQHIATIDDTVSISPRAAARLSNDFSHLPDIELSGRNKPKTRHPRLWLAATLLLACISMLEAVYLLRVEIAAHLPGLKPALVKTCEVLHCNIPLPQKIDLLSIESSQLESDPAHANIITLHTVIRSRADYNVSYPVIELTLTDTLDSPVARRNFAPGDYVSKEEIARGLPANRETLIKLHLNTTDLAPAGYRLLLFYPQ